MEFILHYMYIVAIKDRKAWIGASPAVIAMIGFLEFDHRMAQGDHTMLHPSSIY
jgi:D-alanyl-lipoteichoic acid acyltransferase DltB (MBOAT superfamily)